MLQQLSLSQQEPAPRWQEPASSPRMKGFKYQAKSVQHQDKKDSLAPS